MMSTFNFFIPPCTLVAHQRGRRPAPARPPTHHKHLPPPGSTSSSNLLFLVEDIIGDSRRVVGWAGSRWPAGGGRAASQQEEVVLECRVSDLFGEEDFLRSGEGRKIVVSTRRENDDDPASVRARRVDSESVSQSVSHSIHPIHPHAPYLQQQRGSTS
jgi:hypothetical protein